MGQEVAVLVVQAQEEEVCQVKSIEDCLFESIAHNLITFSDIFFGRNGNRDSPSGGSSNNNYDRNYDDRRQQPAPSSGGSSSNGGFLSSLSSIFGECNRIQIM